MRKDLVLELQFGIRKVYAIPTDAVVPSNHEWIRREIIAEFVGGDQGDFAFACFKEGLAKCGGSLRDGQGIYHVGTISELGIAISPRFVADPAAR